MGIRIAAIIILVAMCSGQVAMAAGIEVPPNFYDWTGVYVGANAGYGTGNISDSINGTQAFSGVPEAKSVPIYSIETLFSESKSLAIGRISKALDLL